MELPQTLPVAEDITVDLCLARLPGQLGHIAVHYWFVLRRGDSGVERWEVWQHPDVAGNSWGHLHQNLKPAYDGVGNGPSWTERTWTGAPAAKIAETLERAPENYPACKTYWLWPGPNSNTFVQWILTQADQSYRLGPLGHGAFVARYL